MPEVAIEIAAPSWAAELRECYLSNSANQFVLYGNVDDRIVIPRGDKPLLGTVADYLLGQTFADFDIIVSYDVGQGLHIARDTTGETGGMWGYLAHERKPQAVIPALNEILLYYSNLQKIRSLRLNIGFFMKDAHLIVPEIQGLSQDINSIAQMLKSWSTETTFTDLHFALVMTAPTLAGLHPMIRANVKTVKIEVPMPSKADLECFLDIVRETYPIALEKIEEASGMEGLRLSDLETSCLRKQYKKDPITPESLTKIRRNAIEADSGGRS